MVHAAAQRAFPKEFSVSVKITMIGTGYVGLVTGACFAELGHDVICVDKDAQKIARIKAGEMPIYEPGLSSLVARNVEQGRLRFSTDTADSVADREAVFIAVGTPSEDTGHADLTYVYAAAKEIGKAVDRFTAIVTKSTVPVGTNRSVYGKLVGASGGDDLFAIASNPEFLREGAAIQDFMEPDRIVIGYDDPRAGEVLTRIYAPLTSRGVPLVSTNIETAEMIKYASNAFLAIKVSFINEVADLCETVGADVRDVATGLGLDRRIGTAFLRTGPGWGGSCFPKDTRALLMTAKNKNVPARIVEAAMAVNTHRKETMVDRVRAFCDGSVKGKRIAVLGVTFKGQTDDMRDSPSLDILPRLVAEGAEVVAFDPSDPSEAPKLLPGVVMVGSALMAARRADALVVLTDWMSFRSLDLKQLASAMARPAMLDLRNLFEEDKVLRDGFHLYAGLGLGAPINGVERIVPLHAHRA
jgi:UDPglucose 6-dehydrogenase